MFLEPREKDGFDNAACLQVAPGGLDPPLVASHTCGHRHKRSGDGILYWIHPSPPPPSPLGDLDWDPSQWTASHYYKCPWVCHLHKIGPGLETLLLQ
jgi:hypothetical protein